MSLYERFIRTANAEALDRIKPDWWQRTSGIAVATLEALIADRRKDLHDQEVLRNRVEVVE